MVILFKGTDKSKNYAPQALALSAGLSATKFLKKTLVLQITTKYPVENYVLGKRINDQSIDTGTYFFEDSGMDSLTRRVGVTAFNSDHFANAVLPAVSSENLFDILEVSKKVESDVEREIIQDPTVIGTIIKSAKKIYDNIFVLANGKAPEVISAILPYMDKSVTCVSQGVKEEISAPACEKNFFLVTDYDYKSTYSIRQMMKVYGNKKTFVMPYNVEFKDYYTDKNMLQYILHNTDPQKSDYSYHLINEMAKLTQILIEEQDFENDEYKITYRTFERSIAEPKELTGDNAYVEVTPKKFLRKEKKEVHVSVDEPFDFENDDDIEIISDKAPLSRKEKKAQKKEAKKEAKRLKEKEKADRKEAARREKETKKAAQVALGKEA